MQGTQLKLLVMTYEERKEQKKPLASKDGITFASSQIFI